MRDVLLPFKSDLRVALASTIVPERGIPMMRDESGILEGLVVEAHWTDRPKGSCFCESETTMTPYRV